MRNLNRLTYLTVVLSFFIVIAAGHGIAFIGLLEIFLFPYIDSGDFSLSLVTSYENSLRATALFALAGQILLIISVLTKARNKTGWLKIAGLIFLWTAFYYLTHNLFHDGAARISFITGIPFLISSGLLTRNIFTSQQVALG